MIGWTVTIKTHDGGWLWRIDWGNGLGSNGFEETFDEASQKASALLKERA